MREILMGAAAAVTAGGAYYTYEPGEVYNMPVEEVATTLETLAFPSELEEAIETLPGADVSISRKGIERVSWTFSLNGLELGEFHANLFSKGPKHTRVTVGFELPEEGIGKHAKDTPLQSNLIKNLADIALVEQVDAVLEKRDYNAKSVSTGVTTYMLTHASEVMAFGKSMKSYAAKVQSGEVESIGSKMMRDPAVRNSFEQSLDNMDPDMSTEERKQIMDRFDDRVNDNKVRYSN